ncbi:MAG: PD-(D/E)XK nuclease family protein [Candidatus Pacearchaeota archaeon]
MIKWSPTRINIANYCTMRYYLRYVLKETPIIQPEYVKGNLIHDIIKNFWKNLGETQDVGIRGRKKYSNAKEFSDYAKRKWDSLCIKFEKSQLKREITWNYERERWDIRRQLEKICYHLFPILVEEGPPLFSELDYEFILFNKNFIGKIDEIRRRNDFVIIRDYKSGRPYMGEMKLNFDPQLTIYSVALSGLIRKDKELAEKLGINEEDINIFKENQRYILPFVKQEFFMVEAPYKNTEGKGLRIINETTRTDAHFFEVIKMIDSIERRIRLGEIVPERGRKCDSCDLKYSCAQKIKDVNKGEFTTKIGQFVLDFDIPHFAKRDEKYEKRKRSIQRKLNLLK